MESRMRGNPQVRFGERVRENRAGRPAYGVPDPTLRDPSPSAEDRAVTDQMVAAGRLLDIPVHDHVIVGRGRYVSFAEAGLL